MLRYESRDIYLNIQLDEFRVKRNFPYLLFHGKFQLSLEPENKGKGGNGKKIDPRQDLRVCDSNGRPGTMKRPAD
jgi:hypothetical protein